MIALSRFRELHGPKNPKNLKNLKNPKNRKNPKNPGALLVLMLGVVLQACSGSNCVGPHCLSGLTVVFDGGGSDASASDETFDVDVATEMNQTFVTLATCSLSSSFTSVSDCRGPTDAGGDWITLGGSYPKTVRVTVSAAGRQLSQQDFAPVYGMIVCGCGSVSSATIHVGFPPAS